MFGRGSPAVATFADDLYAGFDRIPSSSAYEAFSGPSPSSSRYGMTTGFQGVAEDARPMTSVRGAGYRSCASGQFDPLAQGKTTMAALKRKIENGPEFVARELEREIKALIVESTTALGKGNAVGALDRAKEAVKKEGVRGRHCEQHSLSETVVNAGLTFATQLNLAVQYTSNSMMTEALNVYGATLKNKGLANAGRVRVNMGNIYYKQNKLLAAIKMYRMAMDLVGSASKDIGFRIMRNIGIAFVRLGQFQDAIHAFESVMDGGPDSQAGFNLVVCYFALGDKDKMKAGFLQLLMVPLSSESDPDHAVGDGAAAGPIKDPLARYYAQRQALHCRYILCAAKLIAPVIENDFERGYQWLVSSLKAPCPGASNDRMHADSKRTAYDRLAMELDLCNGIAFLKKSEFDKATTVFGTIERQELELHDQAACNLSFLYYLDSDFGQAKKYADLAIQENRYNASALVNRANVCFVEGDYESAIEMYLEAVGIEADCAQAVYNLALVYKQTGRLEDALAALRKLHSLCPKNAEIVYEIGNIYDMINLPVEASEWFKILLGLVPNDANALVRLGRIASRLDDQTQAFHCFTEAYQCNPVCIEVISWLGVWYVKSELYENAQTFFERAAEIEPAEMKWKLMVATCYRRMNQINKALRLYERIHALEPDSVECLKYLVSICTDTRQEALADEYSRKLSILTSREPIPPPPSTNLVPLESESAAAAEDHFQGQAEMPPPILQQKSDEINFDGVELDDELLPM